MQCFNGISLQNGQTVPCGQCLNCRINKGRKWTARLLLENMLTHIIRPGTQSYFLTLTYRDENLPKTDAGNPTLAKKQFLTWLDHYQQRKSKFRYLAVGEYGDNTFRPHYHMAMFHQLPSEVESFCESWKAAFGFYDKSQLVRQRAAYLCQYTVKKLSEGRCEEVAEDAEPEFRTSTRSPPLAHACIPLEVARYRTSRGKALLERQGDVGRTFRSEGKIWPFDNYLLGKIRQELGIPLTHAGRIDANENYLTYHNSQEAEQCLETSTSLESRYHAQKRFKRPSTQRV